MQGHTDPWVLVLAAGSGTRLSELTRDQDGAVVPKQFCSLRGGRSLLLDTIDRALRVTRRDRIVVVVAAEHERWWRPQLACIEPANVIEQPENRGTTAGLLLPLAHILECEPQAVVAVMPSDQYVAEPAVLTRAMRDAVREARADRQHLVLLGIAPDAADVEYGWILPGARTRNDLYQVAAFVEKPPAARATALLLGGALWNSFLFAGAAATLWRLCARFAGPTAAKIAAANQRPLGERELLLRALYRALPTIDFSRTVLGASASQLRLLPVPECGWTDLGTPRRVAECLRQIEACHPDLPRRAPWFDAVDLSRALAARQVPAPTNAVAEDTEAAAAPPERVRRALLVQPA